MGSPDSTSGPSGGSRRLGVLVAVAVVIAGVVAVVWWQTRPSPSSTGFDLRALPGVEVPDEYAFGDAVMARDQHAWGSVFDTLEPRFDRRRLRVAHATLAAEVGAESLRREADRDLVDVRGWRPVTVDVSTARDAWAFGYESPDGDDVLVLVGVEPRPDERLVPLSVVTTLPDDP